MSHKKNMTSILARYRGMSPAVRSSLWYTLCNFLQRGMSLITTPIFTRMLTTDEYGICSVYFTWFEIFVLFTSLKLPYEGLNNGLIRYEEDKDGFASAVLGLITTMTFGWFILYLIFQQWINGVTGLNRILMIMMFIQVMFNPPLYLWTNRERFDFRYRWPVVVTMLSTILSPVIAIFCVLNTEFKAEGRVLGIVLVQGFFGLILYFVTMYRGRKFYVREYWKFAVGFNLPLLLYYLSQTVLSASDRIMIQHMVSSGKAGIYNVSYASATILLLLVTAVNGSLNPWMYRKLKSREYEDIPKLLDQLCLLFAAATLGMCMFAPDLIHIMASAEYQEGIWIVPPVTASVFFTFLYMLFANVEMYYDKNKGIAIVSIVAAVLNLILNALAIPRFGYMAAGWTTLVSYIFLTALHYRLMIRACGDQVDGHLLFPVKRLIGQSVVVLAIVAFGLWLYTLGSGRYVVLVLEIAVLLIFRKKILGLLKGMKKGDTLNDNQ